MESSRSYIPAAGHDWSLPLYDPLVKLMGGDAARRTLLDHAEIRPGHRVLDVGCGTGTLAVMIKRLHPDADVAGLDPDPKAMARARRKAERASAEVRFDRGFSNELPYPDASVDRVVSSFMFHHVPNDEKEATLREARRVLKPDGRLILVDFAGPEASSEGFLSRLFHSSGHFKDNSEESILDLMRRAGFVDAARIDRRTMFLGQARVNYFLGAAASGA
jgi:ubiquinone/menaquinone biosynthesis C-methylase UbiE